MSDGGKQVRPKEPPKGRTKPKKQPSRKAFARNPGIPYDMVEHGRYLLARAKQSRDSADLKAEVIEAVFLGMTIDRSVLRAGVPFEIFSSWIEHDPVFAKALASAGPAGEADLLAKVRVSSETDSRAAAWLLERGYGDRWVDPQIQFRRFVHDEGQRSIPTSQQVGLTQVRRFILMTPEQAEEAAKVAQETKAAEQPLTQTSGPVLSVVQPLVVESPANPLAEGELVLDEEMTPFLRLVNQDR